VWREAKQTLASRAKHHRNTAVRRLP